MSRMRQDCSRSLVPPTLARQISACLEGRPAEASPDNTDRSPEVGKRINLARPSVESGVTSSAPISMACHNNDAPTQPPSGEIMPDGDDESVSAEEVEPTDDDGATTEELGPAELEVAQPGRVNPPD